MDKVMRIRRENPCAICRVMAVGKDQLGSGWILMERMGGDLRNLIDRGVRYVGYVEDGQMHYAKDGQMPFHYSDTIKMMIDIARGMKDLDSCGLIHRDLKAANILVTALPLNTRRAEVIGLEQGLETLDFCVTIGDYESSNDIVGTGFWRPPEVLQALKDGIKPVWSPEGDVYSFGMLCYELLTGRIPFEDHLRSDYAVVLSGHIPELPVHVNSRMRNLLHSCWQIELQKRPSWTTIIKSLEGEFELHRPSVRNPRLYRRLPELETLSSDIEDESVGSSSTGLPTSSMEFRLDVENQIAGSSSTGVQEIQGARTGCTTNHVGLRRSTLDQETPKPLAPCQMEVTSDEAGVQRVIDFLYGLAYPRLNAGFDNEVANETIFGDGLHNYLWKDLAAQRVIALSEKIIAVLQKRAVGKLAVIWEEVDEELGAQRIITFSEEQIALQKKRAPANVAVFWEAGTKRGITLDTLLEEFSRASMKRKAMQVSRLSRVKELIIAFDVAVKQDVALESCVAQSLTASRLWQLVEEHVNVRSKNVASEAQHRSKMIQECLHVWHAESPVAFKRWQEVRRADDSATSKAWRVAKQALQEVEKIMVEETVVALKRQFLAGMFRIDSKRDIDDNWWDLEAAMDRYCLAFKTTHSHPSSWRKFDRWIRSDDLLADMKLFNPISFMEMVRIIKEATGKSLTLEILLGGWKSNFYRLL